MQKNTEQEWQFTAAELDAARAWLAAQPADPSERRLAAKPTLELTDTYYDSADWMIFRAGFALRLRREHTNAGAQTEVTLKSLSAPHNGIARRTEFSERVGGEDMNSVLAAPSGIGGRIRELIGERPLSPLFKANTRRERQELLEAGSTLPLAEVDLDETSIETPSGASHQLKRVEVECLNATPEALQTFVEQLRDAARLEPVVTSKFRAGLDAAGLHPGRLIEPSDTPISATQPFADTQLALLRQYFSVLLEKEPLVRAGSTGALHEMRVAARHLDVFLRLFTGYGPRWATESRGTVRALIKALGAVRDGDVQLDYLRTSHATLGDEDRAAIEPLRQQLAEKHVQARAQLLRFLDSNRMRGWVEHWLAQLQLGTASSERARQAVTARVACDLIRESARRLRKRADSIHEKSSEEAFHEVRIRAKRLRYAVDAFGSLYGDAAREYTRALARMQTLLGDFHDSSVRTEVFADLVTQGRRVPAATTFLVGRLVERDQQRFDKCRRKFAKAYRRITRRRWRALLEAMREEAGKAAS